MSDPLSQETLCGATGYLVKPVSANALNLFMNKIERDGETTILLVDDDPDAVRLLEQMLTILPRPYRILKAYNGEEALELMAQNIPDLVLLDLIMPGMDGAELLRRMRQDERLDQVPVVIVSAQDALDGTAAMGAAIALDAGEELDITRGAACLRAMLDAVAPRYLTD